MFESFTQKQFRLGDLLVEKHLITQSQRRAAAKDAGQTELPATTVPRADADGSQFHRLRHDRVFT
jgi:hypothetical protein